jgi:hypothetical protein
VGKAQSLAWRYAVEKARQLVEHSDVIDEPASAGAFEVDGEV